MKAGAFDKRDARLLRALFCLVRNHRGRIQDDFAKELGIGLRHLQAIEYGEKLPSLKLLFRCLRLSAGAPLERLRKLSPTAGALEALAAIRAVPLPAAAVSPPPLPLPSPLPQLPAQWGQP